MNEEEIKVKFVLPWLERAGISLQEIQLERSFSLRIGRQAIVVGQPQRQKNDTVGGRLDILVQRSGRNLLIVETKAEGLELTDDDRDQAISYARLVHPIAPYAVVTNGTDYRLYDTITKTKIDPKDIKIYGFEASLPDAYLAEAQELFLALNSANLSAFCQSQVTGEMRLVKGTLADGKKYVPELHVPRELLVEEVKQFYASTLPGLLLIGQSGAGKTCDMCWLAESLLNEGKPVLFFNGVALEGGILDAIAAEFSWTFSGSELPIQVIRRMAVLAGCEQLTIIVDAIDEWIYESRENHLGSLLRAAENHNIKIIASCKSSAVERFLSLRGTQTNIALLAKMVEAREFTSKEFFSALDKYRQAYQFFGGFEDAVLEEARTNPFLLRVLFDVARDSNIKHLTFSSAELFETYFHRSVERTKDVRQASDTLKAIAGLLYSRDSDWIPEDEVRTALSLRVNESLMEELFEYGILLRNESETATPSISFYFQQLRDYIVAFKTQQFYRMTAKCLAEEFSGVTSSGMRGDVFTLYYRLATPEHKFALDGELRENATSYLKLYTSLVYQLFPALRETFKPRTSGRVGFIGELLLVQRCLGAYGFRSIGDADDEVYFVPVQEALGRSNVTFLAGAGDLHATSGAFGFRNGINIRSEVIDNELLDQLRKFVKEGMLDESDSPEMLSEVVIESVLHNRALFRELLDVDGGSIRYPLKLSDVSTCLLREKLARHYRDDLIAHRRRSGQINEAWDGDFVSYSLQLTPEDEKQIAKAVEYALVSGDIPPIRARYLELEALEASLAKAVDNLHAIRTEIEGPVFPGEHKLKSDAAYRHPIAGDDAKAYLSKLYSDFLAGYKAIIEKNFPTLKEHFKLYSMLPVSVHLVLDDPRDHGVRGTRTGLDAYFSASKRNNCVVEVVNDFECDAADPFCYRVGGVEYQAHYVHQSSFENLFSHSHLKQEKFDGMTLRTLVYRTISDELKGVEKALRAEYMNVRGQAAV